MHWPAPTCSSWESREVSQIQKYPKGARGPRPMLGSQYGSTNARKRISHTMWLEKSAGISYMVVRLKTAGKPGVLLKGLWTDSLTQKHSHFTLAEATVSQEVLQTYREKLNCVAAGWGLERQLSLSLCWALLLHSREVGIIFPVLNHFSHTVKSESVLTWWTPLALPW